MLTGSSLSGAGLSVRPARATDGPFLETLYRSARSDLQCIDADPELVETVVAQQYRMLQSGAGSHFPNAMHFVIEKTQTCIGGLVVDFGHNEARVIYLAFIPAARGYGYGGAVLQGIQQAAASAGCPVTAVVWRNNVRAKRLYLELGFQVDASHPLLERLMWYPGATTRAPGAR
jgi:ribosomal protein S18 acetylase RimI-like enzyme